MRATVGANSYCPGETLEIRLSPDDAVSGDADISNISIDVLRVDTDRNRLAFGFGMVPEVDGDVWLIRDRIPANLRPGLHCISQVVLSRGTDIENIEHRNVQIAPLFFQVRSVIEVAPSHDRLREIIREVETARVRYVRTPIRTQRVESGEPAVQFRAIVFATGCLVDGTHQMAGYKLVPLGEGLSHRRMLEIVNGGLAREGIEVLPYIEATEQEFSSNTPTFMIDYPVVSAVDHIDAFAHCHEHAARVFRALCLERGGMPERFASFALQYETRSRWHEFKSPWYRGTLLGDFDPATTADAIDRLLPMLQMRPFVRLLVSTFTDGIRETEYGFKLLRYWSVLELVADQAIPRNATPILHPDGSPILNVNGNSVTQTAKVARVYASILRSDSYMQTGSYLEHGVERRYIIGGDTSHAGYSLGVELISLWDMVRATYAIRNAVAHEGQFDEGNAYPAGSSEALAVRFKQNASLDPLRFAQTRAQIAVWKANGGQL